MLGRRRCDSLHASPVRNAPKASPRTSPLYTNLLLEQMTVAWASKRDRCIARHLVRQLRPVIITAKSMTSFPRALNPHLLQSLSSPRFPLASNQSLGLVLICLIGTEVRFEHVELKRPWARSRLVGFKSWNHSYLLEQQMNFAPKKMMFLSENAQRLPAGPRLQIANSAGRGEWLPSNHKFFRARSKHFHRRTSYLSHRSNSMAHLLILPTFCSSQGENVRRYLRDVLDLVSRAAQDQDQEKDGGLYLQSQRVPQSQKTPT